MSRGNAIGDAIARTLGDVSIVDTSVQLIPLERLHANRLNFYPSPTLVEIEDLAESIALNGLLEPLIVTPDQGGAFRIISGHSRWQALKCLTKTRADITNAVPCVVLPAMSDAQELTAVIEANRQRVKNSATLAMEAEKLTEAYKARKNAGEELPGRIRTRVADSLKVSESQLAMAAATKKNLTLPGFKAQWENGDIPDTVAYEISKMSGDHQYRLLDWCINNGRPAGSLKVAEVKQLEEQFSSRPRKWDMSKEKEDAMFMTAVRELLVSHFRVELSLCQSRSEAIQALKKANVNADYYGPDWMILCPASHVVVRNGGKDDAPDITRSWTETYDALCIVAMQKMMSGWQHE